jgi:hypothetical protein
MIRSRASSGRDAPLPPGEYCSEANDNLVVILLTYGTVRVLLAGDSKVREEYMVAALKQGLKRSSRFRNYTHTLNQGSAHYC